MDLFPPHEPTDAFNCAYQFKFGSPGSAHACSDKHYGRFEQDFEIENAIGSGQFGIVHRCRSRLDGCVYAIKRSLNKFRGKNDRDRVLREVHALAHLGTTETPYIVKYHQSWIEDERLFIQVCLKWSVV
jgi:wee1-like protein kinase